VDGQTDAHTPEQRGSAAPIGRLLLRGRVFVAVHDQSLTARPLRTGQRQVRPEGCQEKIADRADDVVAGYLHRNFFIRPGHVGLLDQRLQDQNVAEGEHISHHGQRDRCCEMAHRWPAHREHAERTDQLTEGHVDQDAIENPYR